MDIEFHYYMTYLIAARAGFKPADATILAQSAQEIDDNHIAIEVGAGTPFDYKNTISRFFISSRAIPMRQPQCARMAARAPG